jgi:hypothetical protein
VDRNDASNGKYIGLQWKGDKRILSIMHGKVKAQNRGYYWDHWCPKLTNTISMEKDYSPHHPCQAILHPTYIPYLYN